MSTTETDLVIELTGLKREIQIAESNISDYVKRRRQTDRENALIYCLKQSIELSKGCAVCTEKNLLSPQYLLTRGLLEYLIWTCWIIKSQENAYAYINISRNELKRLANKNLKEGHGRAVDKVTHEDKTQELLNSEWKTDIRRRLKIEDAAKEAGLDKIYTQMYGFLSIFAHGVMLETKSDVAEEITDVLAMASVLMECINLVTKDWMIYQKQTPIQDIYTILH